MKDIDSLIRKTEGPKITMQNYNGHKEEITIKVQDSTLGKGVRSDGAHRAFLGE